MLHVFHQLLSGDRIIHHATLGKVTPHPKANMLLYGSVILEVTLFWFLIKGNQQEHNNLGGERSPGKDKPIKALLGAF